MTATQITTEMLDTVISRMTSQSKEWRCFEPFQKVWRAGWFIDAGPVAMLHALQDEIDSHCGKTIGWAEDLFSNQLDVSASVTIMADMVLRRANETRALGIIPADILELSATEVKEVRNESA